MTTNMRDFSGNLDKNCPGNKYSKQISFDLIKKKIIN